MSDSSTFNVTVRRDDVTVRQTKHTITSWTAHFPELSLDGKGPTIPAALRDLAASIETFALAEMTKMIEEREAEA